MGQDAGRLVIRDLTVRYGTGHRAVTAVDGVDLTLEPGRVLGLVGESGSGKSTLARAVVGLAPVTGGQIRYDGIDLAAARGRQGQALRRRVQMVFQDPYSSLNPRLTIGEAIGEALAMSRSLSRRDRQAEVARLLDMVSLDPSRASALPRQLSGGQRQRVAIARALAAQPTVLLADEVTSALDVSVQGVVLNLLREIQARLGLSMLFISHNLAVVRYVSDVIAVMYLGQVVEVAPAEELICNPRHPYTRSLLAAVPRLGGQVAQADGQPTDADPPDPSSPPTGCRFHSLCPVGPLVRRDRDVCQTTDPHALADDRPHRTACHFVEASTEQLAAARD